MPILIKNMLETKWEKEFSHKGFSCKIWRNPEFGFLCGYIILGPDHPWAGKFMDDLSDIDVHGGITYSQKEDLNPEAQRYNWCIGFDCMHAGDFTFSTFTHKDYYSLLGVNKDIDYVTEECKKLADQAYDAMHK